MKILITGGAGFIGSHLIKRLVRNYPDYSIFNLDLLTYAGNLENLREVEKLDNYTFIKGDISNRIFIDNLFNGNEDNLKEAISKGVIFYKDDTEFSSSLDYIFEKHNIDIVFNCATKALNHSFVNPKNSFDTNVHSILNLLEHQRKGSFKTLAHFSTSEVYGTAVYEPMDEKTNKPNYCICCWKSCC